jgi:hypothetical protein
VAVGRGAEPLDVTDFCERVVAAGYGALKGRFPIESGAGPFCFVRH